jgi:hypothetical protein
VNRDTEGVVRKEEVERCIREVLDGVRKEEYKKNAYSWMTKAKKAMQEGGELGQKYCRVCGKVCLKLMFKVPLW